MPSRRRLMTDVRAALALPTAEAALAALAPLAPINRQGPLFSLLLSPEAVIGWRAVAAFGASMADMAAARLEDAREV